MLLGTSYRTLRQKHLFLTSRNLIFPMKISLTIVCLAVLLSSTNAQNKSDKVTMNWGETDLLDRRMTVYTPEPTAEAVVLNNVTRVRIELQNNRPLMTVQVHRRIKIMSENAAQSQSSIKLPINVPANRVVMGTRKAQLIDINEAQTAIPIEESKEGNVEQINLSQVKSGYILEYRYDFTTDSVPLSTTWVLQENIPVRRSELWASLGAAFETTFVLQNKEKINNFVDAGSNAKVFIASDLPALQVKNSSFIKSDNITSVRLQVNSTSGKGGKQAYNSTWRDLAQNLSKSENLGAQYLQKENYDNIWRAMQSSVNGAKNTEEKIRAVYNFINKNVEWNGEWSIYAKQALNATYENHTANSGELNLMLVACLNAAGVRATPMLMSTRSHGKVNVNGVSAGQFDHLVCHTELNGAPCFLDAGDVFRPMGLLRVEALNGDGWLMDVAAPQWVKIIPTLSVRQSLSTFSLSKEGDLRGKFSKTSKGYEAVTQRNDQNRKAITQSLQKEYSGIRIDSVTTYNLDLNLNSSFKRNFYCVIPQAIEAVDNRMTIKPLWQTGLESNILQEQRANPIDFAYPINDLHVFNLSIPEGASVDKMPKDELLELANKGGAYQFTAVQSGNIVQLTIRVQIERLHFDASEYSKVKELFDRVAAKQLETVVLKNVRTEALSSSRR
jgi:transglutaminase-like putative cysteine protease